MRLTWSRLVNFGALCKVFVLSVVLTLALASSAFAAGGTVNVSANLPNTDSWTLTKTFYSNNTSCSTTPSPSSTQVTLTGENTDTTSADNKDSVKLQASSVSGGGQRFFSQWTSPSNDRFDNIDFRTICVRGLNNGTKSYVANYVRPTLSINDVTVTEGDPPGTTNTSFTVSLSAPISEPVTVDYTTDDDTPHQPGDYTPTSDTLTFTPGETTKSVTVSVNHDTTDEANETFFVNLSNATNATIDDDQGVGTIVDDDGTPQANDDSSTENPITLNEDDPNGVITNVLANDSGLDDTPITVQVTTQPTKGTATVDTSNNPNKNNRITYTPSANQNGPDSYRYTVTDSDGDSSTATVYLQITPVNDAPRNTVPGAQSTNEDTALVFSDANNNQISISDVDAEDNPIQVTLSATNGTLTLNGTTGLAFTSGANGTANMTFTGTITNINNALNGLRFDPNQDYNGSASFTITTNDQGNTGSGEAKSDADTVTMKVRPVNDKPGFIKGGDPSILEDAGKQRFPGWSFDISPGPANESDQTVWFKVWEYNLTRSSGAMFSKRPAVSPKGMLTFTPADNASGKAIFGMKLMDDGGRANGGENASAEQRFRITIRPINDRPTVELIGDARKAKEGETKTYDYKVKDVDEPDPIIESCGARGKKIDTPAKNSFKCFFPDGPATSVVSVGADVLAKDEITVHIANVAPRVTLSGPRKAKWGQEKVYRFTVDDPGDDAFVFAAGYPKCGEGGRLAGKNIGAGGGSFRCEFRSPARTAVALRVKDSDGALSKKATRKVTVADNGGGRCDIKGTKGNDNLRGTPGPDVICGLGGNDTIFGLGGHDVIYGGSGNDVLKGGNGRLRGGPRSDKLQGGQGRDKLYGGGGRDVLDTKDGAGGDLANGGPGADPCDTDPGDKKVSCR